MSRENCGGSRPLTLDGRRGEPHSRRVNDLAEDFPTPTLDQWRALASKGLKGESFERLVSHTPDGLVIQPLYAADPDGPALEARPPQAEDAARPWDLRSWVEHPDPGEANTRALDELAHGAASLLVAVDPDGRRGVAIGSQDDLARTLDGVLLDLAPVALDAGWLGSEAANWLAVLAKGAPEAPLAFHLDPLSVFAVEGTSPGPIEAHVSAAAQTAARHAGAYPKATLFMASGGCVHEAGGPPDLELGVMAAAAVAYLRAMDQAGLPPKAALERIVLGLSADADYFVTLAKLRAARAIWARIVEACGGEGPARIEARASRRMLSAADPWTNLLRLTAAGFGAGVGGADAVVLEPFSRPLGAPDPLARRQARNTQLVLMEEAALGRVADPAGGAFFLERLTDDLARGGWAALQAIETAGGLAAALSAGQVADAVAAGRARLATAISDGAAPLVGVTVFPDADGVKVPVEQLPTRTASAPDPRQAGADGRCPPLPPIRLSEPHEGAS